MIAARTMTFLLAFLVTFFANDGECHSFLFISKNSHARKFYSSLKGRVKTPPICSLYICRPQEMWQVTLEFRH